MAVADPLILEAALKFAAAGWPVMPLAGAVPVGDRLTCACWKHDGCISPAKHPRTANGLFDATTSEEVVRSWFRGYKALNIGIRTGVVCDVVDIDAGGLDSLGAWMRSMPVTTDPDEQVLAIWDGPVVKTGHGYHLYLRPAGCGNGAKILPGIDYRGNGGYVVAAPSVHVTGTRYEWLRKGRLIDAPEWLRDVLFPPTCDHVLRGGRACGKSKTHAHGEVVFTSLVDQRMEVPS